MPSTAGENMGLRDRAVYTWNEKSVDMLGPLFLDIANQERLIINNVRIKFKFYPSADEFLLINKDTGVYKTVIEDIKMKVAAVQVAPRIMAGHALAMEKGPAQYYIKRSELKTFAIPASSDMYTATDLFCNRVPSRLIIGFVDSAAYLGNESLNPFNFANYNIKFLSFYVDNCPHPRTPFTPDFPNKLYVDSYLSLFYGDGTLNTNDSNNITREDYPGGYTLFVLPVALYRGSDFLNAPKFGTTSLSVNFGTSLTKAVTMICYATYDDILEIDKVRNVSFKKPPSLLTTATMGYLDLDVAPAA